jgi:hypothetical protein
MVRISVQRLKERYTAKKDAAPLQYARYFRCALERIAHMLKDRMRQDRIKAIIAILPTQNSSSRSSAGYHSW